MPAPSATPALAPPVQLRGVSHHFGGLPVLAALDFELPAGRITAFLGRNGAGKSTTLAILAGLIRPVSGSVRILGRDPARQAPARASIGYLPERPPLYPPLSVDEHLELAARLRGVARKKRAEAVARVRERFELGELRRRPAAHLSKGMQQRLGLAMAVVHSPPVVLLDEPGSGLDPVQLKRLGQAIVELGRECCVLYSTHMLNEALAVADHVMVLCEGRLLHAGGVDDLGETPETRLLAWMSGEGEP